MSYEFQTLSVDSQDALATVSIKNGDINLLDAPLIKDLYKCCKQISEDNTIKVVIFQSANPEFFVAHADVNMIMAAAQTPQPDGQTPSMLQSLYELIRNLPQVTIGKIAGVARGGGSELLLAMDMRFAAKNKARLGQPEVALGLIAGAGGCTRLPKLMGRGRAMEVLLGCEDFDAELAERYGYINRAIDDSELDNFVDTLGKRIAHYPAHALQATKALVNEMEQIQPQDFGREYGQFYATATKNGMAERMQQALDNGLQTFEKEVDDLAKVTDPLPYMN
ncbi:enoyl-CoA hydratase/isomerase family protein [Oceaniserpentilla sp. 4NH20-0058]|uniref:enoyl-CoA hydratase/isomerase family protein n=1 Tax=Oceaniserpentilla sp. 4NH20-0058 TaxID=3127660 RepID=UPI003103A9A8